MGSSKFDTSWKIGVGSKLGSDIHVCPRETGFENYQKWRLDSWISSTVRYILPGARFSKDPVITGPVNLPGRLTGNFTGPGIAFLKAPVNFPDTYRAR